MRRKFISPWDHLFAKFIDQNISNKIYVESFKKKISHLLSQIKTEELAIIGYAFSKDKTKSSRLTEVNTLAKVANWLSTVKPQRDLSQNEKDILTRILSEMRTFSDESDLKWSQFIGELNSRINSKPNLKTSPFDTNSKKEISSVISSDSIERFIHRGLNTGPKLTNGLASLGEPRLILQILDLVPESEIASKAQVNQQWRKLLSDYYRIKRYPLDPLPDEDARLDQRESKKDFISLSSIPRSQGYQIFFHSISKVITNHMLKTRGSIQSLLSVLGLELRDKMKNSIGYSKLNRLTDEIIKSILLGQSHLSEEGKRILVEYEELARAGNVYAQQTVSWIQEFTTLGAAEKNFFYPEGYLFNFDDTISTSNCRWPKSFPDYKSYKRWNEADHDHFESLGLRQLFSICSFSAFDSSVIYSL